jgi:hypothetical protein
METWVVQQILAEDLNDKGEVVYLIKWLGYTDDDTWEPLSSIASCTRVLAEWKAERNAQRAAADESTLVKGRLPYPIRHRLAKAAQRRSFADDQAADQAEAAAAAAGAEGDEMADGGGEEGGAASSTEAGQVQAPSE